MAEEDLALEGQAISELRMEDSLYAQVASRGEKGVSKV